MSSALTALLLLLPAFALACAGYLLLRLAGRRLFPASSAQAKVVSIRAEAVRTWENRLPEKDVLLHARCVTFEFEDGAHRRFLLPLSSSKALAEGELGCLTWRGSDFISFHH